MGTVEPGKLANLVFLAKNPLDGVELSVCRAHRKTRPPVLAQRLLVLSQLAMSQKSAPATQ